MLSTQEQPNIEQLRAGPNLSKESLPALYAMALEFYRNGKYDEAKDMFFLLTVSDVDDKRHWMGLAASYQMLREYSPAIECYSMAAVIEPDDPMSHWHAAECYFATGNQSMALVALESAIDKAKQHKTLQPLVDELLVVQEIWQRSPL